MHGNIRDELIQGAEAVYEEAMEDDHAASIDDKVRNIEITRENIVGILCDGIIQYKKELIMESQTKVTLTFENIGKVLESARRFYCNELGEMMADVEVSIEYKDPVDPTEVHNE